MSTNVSGIFCSTSIKTEDNTHIILSTYISGLIFLGEGVGCSPFDEATCVLSSRSEGNILGTSARIIGGF